MLPGLMSLDFSCDIWMVGSRFCLNSMNARILPALYQEFKRLLVVLVEDIFLENFGPLSNK